MLLRSISSEDWLCYYSDSGFACNKDDAGDGDGNIEDDERVHYLSEMVMVMMVEVVRMMLRMTKGSII